MQKTKKQQITSFASLFPQALRELIKNDPLRMAGATAFFTTFALPPILVILIQVFRLVVDPKTIRAELFKSLSDIVGQEAVDQVVEVLIAIRGLAQNWYITIGGFVFLLFVATTLFKVIKSSINQIWKVRVAHKRGIWKSLRSRVQAILVILVAGVLFMAGIVAETVRAMIGDYIFDISPQLSFYFNNTLRYFLSLFVVTLWFMIVFRFLTDGRPSWRVAFAGSLVTGVLFSLGKIVLHWLLSYSNLNNVYGTSASVVLLLLFVFYSALILYYGAAFTKTWGVYRSDPIRPMQHAMHYRIIESEVETDGKNEA
ncbi:MAG: YihY/virulence factor BrkB family protein [Flavisolibacter sp.]